MDDQDQTSKIPPHNVDAEASLLGSILIDSNTLTQVSDRLRIDDFYDPRHQTIYEAMVKLYDTRKPVDHLTLTAALKDQAQLEEVGGSSYLTELTNTVPTAAHAEHYADIIRHKGQRRRLIGAAEQMINNSYADATPVEEVLDNAEKDLFAVTETAIRQDLVSMESILTESFDRLDEMQKDSSKLRGIPTGYRDLDNKLAGLHKSDLVILAARPAMGKSTLMMNIAHNVAVAQKSAVLVFSLEMSKEQLVDRMLAAEAGIDAWNIRTGKLSESDFEKLGLAMGTLSEAPIYIDDTPGISINEIRTKARREQHKHPLGLIVVDYLQLMTAARAGGSDNRVQEISEISRGLKAIAREMNVPLLALSQLSRSVESRSPQIPQLADLRESGSIEQDADIVMFMYREDYYNPETDRQHITDIYIKKHRNGPTGQIELYFHPEQLKFMTIDKSHKTEEDS